MKPYIDIFLSRPGLVLILGAGMLFLSWSSAHLIAFIFIYTAYDVLGFRDIDQGRGSEEYRIIQGMFKIAILAVVGFLTGWLTVAACVVAWYLLACDVLYYWCIATPLDDFTWFLGSPVPFVYNVVFKVPAPAWAVRISAIVGTIIGLFLIINYG